MHAAEQRQVDFQVRMRQVDSEVCFIVYRGLSRMGCTTGHDGGRSEGGDAASGVASAIKDGDLEQRPLGMGMGCCMVAA